MEKLNPSPCPLCGGERIDVKRKVLKPMESGNDNVHTWAFCRNCGHRGLSALGRFSVEEGYDAAIRLWNENK